MVFYCFLHQRWAVISKTQMKNTKKAFNREQMKNDAKDKKEVCSFIWIMTEPLNNTFIWPQNDLRRP